MFDSIFDCKVAFSVAAIEQRAIVDHMQRSFRVGGIYSAPASALSCQPLLGQSHKDVGAAATSRGAMRLNADVEPVDADERLRTEAAPPPPGGPTGEVFFRVIACRPARAKTVRVTSQQQRSFGQHDLCIVFHDSVRSAGSNLVSVEATAQPRSGGGGSLAILDAFRSDTSIVKTDMMTWKRAPKPAFFIRDMILTDEQRNTFTEICQHGAFPGSMKELKVSRSWVAKQDALVSLQDAGMVEKMRENETDSSWQVTRACIPKLAFAHRVVDRSCFFCVRDHIAIDDMTSWELLESLQAGGWEFKLAPKDKKKRQALSPYCGSDSVKVLYLPSPNLVSKRLYAICLLRSQEKFADGSLIAIHHCQTDKYYKRILQNKSNGILAIEDGRLDCDVDGEDGDGGGKRLMLQSDVQELLPLQDDTISTRLARSTRAANRIAIEDGDDGDDASLGSAIDESDYEAGMLEADEESNKSSDTEFGSSKCSSRGPSPSPPATPRATGDGNDDAPGGGVGDSQRPEPEPLGEPAGGPPADDDDLPPEPGPEQPPLPPPDSPPPAPPVAAGSPARSARSSRHNTRTRNPSSIPQWGPFSLTYVAPRESAKYGRWQVTCRYHALNSKTACTKSITPSSQQAIEPCKLLLMHWALQALASHRKRHHWAFPLNMTDVLMSEEVMLLKAQALPEPPSRHDLFMYLNDEVLDATEEGGAAAADVAAAAAIEEAAAAPAEEEAASEEAKASTHGGASASGSDKGSSGSSSSSSSSSSSNSAAC